MNYDTMHALLFPCDCAVLWMVTAVTAVISAIWQHA